MRKQSFNLEDHEASANIAAQNAVFYYIPEYWRLKGELAKAENEFDRGLEQRLQRGQQLLNDMASIAIEVLEKQFKAQEIDSANFNASLKELNDLLWASIVEIESMRPGERRKKAREFRKATERKLGIKTDESEPYETYSRVLATFASQYNDIFSDVADEYDREVVERIITKCEAENNVRHALRGITHRDDLIPLWEEGREEEVVMRCVQIMVEYEAHEKKCPKDEISEIKYSFGRVYDEEKGDWKPLKRVAVKILDHGKLMKLDGEYDISEVIQMIEY